MAHVGRNQPPPFLFRKKKENNQKSNNYAEKRNYSGSIETPIGLECTYLRESRYDVCVTVTRRGERRGGTYE